MTTLPRKPYKEEPLWQIIQDAYPENYFTSPPRRRPGIFAEPSDPNNVPMLRNGRVNRILLYQGTFNPPHRGHFRMFEQAFFGCGDDLNAVAAVVLSCPENLRKLADRDEDYTVVLTQNQKAALWSDALGESTWSWVHYHLDDEEGTNWWNTIEVNIVEITAAKGYEIEFVHIMGPDVVSAARWGGYVPGYHYVLVSDISRDTDYFVNGPGAPAQFANHIPWKQLQVNVSRPKIRLVRPECGYYHLLCTHMKDRYRRVKAEAVAWECKYKEDPKDSEVRDSTVRYIPSRPWHDPLVAANPSSTKLREIVREERGKSDTMGEAVYRTDDKLAKEALSATLLSEQLRVNWEKHPHRRITKLKRTTIRSKK